MMLKFTNKAGRELYKVDASTIFCHDVDKLKEKIAADHRISVDDIEMVIVHGS